MKLALGTVQFGVDYGITNGAGKVSSGQVQKILEYAESQAIDLLDTAALYGDSEQILGRAIGDSRRFKVVTKSLHSGAKPESLADSLTISLNKLNCESVYGFLMHRTDELLGADGDLYYSMLIDLKASQRVEKIGVSVYHPAEADTLSERYDLDIVQLPFSALDQRFASSGSLQRLAARGTEVHARSLFLQGLLLNDPQRLPRNLQKHRSTLQRYHRRCRDHNLSAMEFALGICHQRDDIARYVVGCCSCTQLEEIVQAYRSSSQMKQISYRGIESADESLVIPGNW